MTCLKSTLPVSGTVPTQLTLLRALTEQALPEREHAASRPDAADIEYASWMPDPGAVEFDSWAAYLRHSVR
jgi:hypothetical protein